MTASRHRDGLVRLGHEVAFARVALADDAALRARALHFEPDIVHLLHAYRAGLPWLATGLAERLPFTVTLTGTDLYGGIDHPVEGPVIRDVLTRAGAIVSQNPVAVETLRAWEPRIAGRVRYLPPGILLGREPCRPLREGWVPEPAPLLLHPAGLRPVKGNLELLELLDSLAAEGLRFAAGFCGPVLDEDYGRRFFGALEGRPWARHLGTIPAAAVASGLGQADVVLNHSRSEGLPNALVEAAALGRPILARDIPGNAAVVMPGSNGFLYRDDRAFLEHARALIRDPDLRRRLSLPRPELYDPDRESRCLEAIYRGALGGWDSLETSPGPGATELGAADALSR